MSVLSLQDDMNYFPKEKIIADTNYIKGYSTRHTRNSIHAKIMQKLKNSTMTICSDWDCQPALAN